MKTIKELTKIADLEHSRGLELLNNGQLEKYTKSYKHSRGLELLNNGQLEKYTKSYKLVTELNLRIETLKLIK